MALARVIGSVVVGWLLGAWIGLAISRVVYDGGADQLPILTVPATIVLVYALSFLVFRRR